MRQFAVNRNRSHLVIRSRSDGSTKTVTPAKYYRYHGNAAAIDSKSIKRRKRK